MPKPAPPPLPPPPDDAIRLWIAWQAARERLAEAKRRWPPTGETVASGVAMPLLDERVVVAMCDETQAAIRFYENRWWYGAQDRGEAERAIAEAAARMTGDQA